MVSCEYDLRFLRAGIDQLEKYLLTDNIYWHLDIQAEDGAPPYPQLTLGWLLLYRQRIRSSCDGNGINFESERINREIETIRSKWLSAWKSKARAEFHARLILWQDFLEEYRLKPRDNYNRYHYEVNRRVCLQLLWDEADDIRESDIQMFNALDLVLRARLIPGKFVWDDKIAPSFPESHFWYLYGALPSEGETDI